MKVTKLGYVSFGTRCARLPALSDGGLLIWYDPLSRLRGSTTSGEVLSRLAPKWLGYHLTRDLERAEFSDELQGISTMDVD